MNNSWKTFIQRWIQLMANMMIADSQSMTLARTGAKVPAQQNRQDATGEAGVGAELQGTISG